VVTTIGTICQRSLNEIGHGRAAAELAREFEIK
jgi:hypothetical protein